MNTRSVSARRRTPRCRRWQFSGRLRWRRRPIRAFWRTASFPVSQCNSYDSILVTTESTESTEKTVLDPTNTQPGWSCAGPVYNFHRSLLASFSVSSVNSVVILFLVRKTAAGRRRPRAACRECRRPVPAGCLGGGPDVSHRDRAFKRRRKCAAGDLADGCRSLQYGATLPRHAFAFDLQADADGWLSAANRSNASRPMNSRPLKFTAKFKPA